MDFGVVRRWRVLDACHRHAVPLSKALFLSLVSWLNAVWVLHVCYLTGVLEQVIEKCVPDASAREICEFGDKLILDETSKVFKKEKDSKKGIAFSTCVSVNNCICHFSPIPSESDYILKQGDLAKM